MAAVVPLGLQGCATNGGTLECGPGEGATPYKGGRRGRRGRGLCWPAWNAARTENPPRSGSTWGSAPALPVRDSEPLQAPRCCWSSHHPPRHPHGLPGRQGGASTGPPKSITSLKPSRKAHPHLSHPLPRPRRRRHTRFLAPHGVRSRCAQGQFWGLPPWEVAVLSLCPHMVTPCTCLCPHLPFYRDAGGTGSGGTCFILVTSLKTPPPYTPGGWGDTTQPSCMTTRSQFGAHCVVQTHTSVCASQRLFKRHLQEPTVPDASYLLFSLRGQVSTAVW